MSRHSNSWKWQVALNYLSLTHPRVFCAGTIGREKKDKDSKIVGVNRHISSSIRQIKERSAGANPFRWDENVVRHSSPQLLKERRKRRGKKYQWRKEGYNPSVKFTQLATYRVCLKKCVAAETRIQVIALRRLLRQSGNTLKSVRIFSSLKTRLGKVMLKCIDKMRTYVCELRVLDKSILH